MIPKPDTQAALLSKLKKPAPHYSGIQALHTQCLSIFALTHEQGNKYTVLDKQSYIYFQPSYPRLKKGMQIACKQCLLVLPIMIDNTLYNEVDSYLAKIKKYLFAHA